MVHKVDHNCGVVVAHQIDIGYDLLSSIQNRGKDTTGWVFVGDRGICTMKYIGGVGMFDLETIEDHARDFSWKIGTPHTILGHLRYKTKGSKTNLLDDAHPHTIGGREFVYKNGVKVVVDCEAAIVHNGQVAREHLAGAGINFDEMKTGSDSEALLHYYMKQGIESLLLNVPGAYTLAIADKRDLSRVLVARDSLEMMPGIFGNVRGREIVMASEDVGFSKRGVTSSQDVPGGSYFYLNQSDTVFPKMHRVVKSDQKAHCFFQWLYFANNYSEIEGLNVDRLRRAMGKNMYNLFAPKDIDLVTYLPNCPRYAAEEYWRVYNYHEEGEDIPFFPIFSKKNKNRAFMEVDKVARQEGINQNLILKPSIHMQNSLEGKTILMMDDSIVRGNNIQETLALLNGTGVEKVYFVSYTPPIGVKVNGVEKGCHFGVDMPPESDFIAKRHNIPVYFSDTRIIRTPTTESMSKEVIDEGELDFELEIVYPTVPTTLKVFESQGFNIQNLCYNCVGGPHPFNQEMR